MFFRRKSENRFLVVGLGNPGKKYQYTRHNVGFLALDFLAERLGISVKRVRFSALTGEGKIAGTPVTLLKPNTFMNLSGASVEQAAKYYKTPPQQILVLCDDVALSPGVIRIRVGGSSGGHNGLRSVEDHLGTGDYPRIRIGVGEKRGDDLADHVLAMPSSADRAAIEQRFSDVCEAVKLIVSGELERAQSQYN